MPTYASRSFCGSIWLTYYKLPFNQIVRNFVVLSCYCWLQIQFITSSCSFILVWCCCVYNRCSQRPFLWTNRWYSCLVVNSIISNKIKGNEMKNTTSTNLFIKQKLRCRSFWYIWTENVLSIDRKSDMFCRFRYSASKWRHSCWSYVSWNVRNFDVLNAFRMIIDYHTATAAAAAASAPVSYFIGVPRWCVVPEWKLESVPEKRAKSEAIRQNILVRMIFVPLYSTKEK